MASLQNVPKMICLIMWNTNANKRTVGGCSDLVLPSWVIWYTFNMYMCSHRALKCVPSHEVTTCDQISVTFLVNNATNMSQSQLLHAPFSSTVLHLNSEKWKPPQLSSRYLRQDFLDRRDRSRALARFFTVAAEMNKKMSRRLSVNDTSCEFGHCLGGVNVAKDTSGVTAF